MTIVFCAKEEFRKRGVVTYPTNSISVLVDAYGEDAVDRAFVTAYKKHLKRETIN